jgi:DNA-nicking Smr family endonuclease
MKKEPSYFAPLLELQQRLQQEALLREQEALRLKQQQAEQDLRRSAEERERRLFFDYVKDVTPLAVKARHSFAAPAPLPIAHQRALDEQRALAESISDEFDAESLIDTDDLLTWQRDGLGSDVVRRLRRGDWVIQDQLDLHGARRDEARELVGQFLRDAIKRGLRCVRVIHGKGHGSIDRQPVLKNRVRRWLTQKDEVLAFCQARAQDGGAGALVVLLRGGAKA